MNSSWYVWSSERKVPPITMNSTLSTLWPRCFSCSTRVRTWMNGSYRQRMARMLTLTPKHTQIPCRLIARIRLRRVLEIGIGTSRTVQTHASRVRNMGTTMRLAHHRLQ